MFDIASSMNPSTTIYYCLVISVSAWMTWRSFRLWKQCRLDFLKDFFIFILTFCLYGFLNFTGQVFLVQIYPDGGFDRILGDIIVFTLAIPVLVVWIYFFILWMTRVCSIGVRRNFKIAYWIVNGILILTNFLAIRVLTDTRDPAATEAILFWKIPFYICLILGTCIVVLFRSGRLKFDYRRHFARFLSVAYMTGFICMVLFGDILDLPFYSDRFLYLAFLSFIYFSINFLPLGYISSAVKSHLNELTFMKSEEIDPAGEFAAEFSLTRREREVSTLAIQGMSNDEIADALYISVQTVKNNMSAVFRKTGVKNRVQLGNILRNYEDS
jgi:DNA-binding CsgD family transcriptional regulator